MTDSPNSIHFDSKLTTDICYNGISVLIVEKEINVQRSLSEVLSKFFSKVVCVSDLESAESLRKTSNFDIIILDIDFPDDSGIEWYEKLEEQKHTNNCVIFMASYAELTTAIHAMKVGACDFILKPFNIEQLVSSVQSCANRIMGQRIRFALAHDIDKTVDHKDGPSLANDNMLALAESSTSDQVTYSTCEISNEDETLSSIRGYPHEWTLREVEKAHILQVVEYFNGNKSAASKVLGVSRKTLERKFKEWGY